MKKILILSIVLIVNLFAQTVKETDLLNTEREYIKFTKSEDNIYKIEYLLSEKVLYKNTGKYETKTLYPLINTTTINIGDVDTTQYTNMYSFWQEVLVAQETPPVVVADLNNNGLPEIYGYRFDYGFQYDDVFLRIFEADSITKQFKDIYSYPDSIGTVIGVYDVNKNNLLELYTHPKKAFNGLFYRQDSDNSLPLIEDIHYYHGFQMNNTTFGDFDNNGKINMIYWSLNRIGTIITEYNESINNFDSIYNFQQPDIFAAGYTIADIDSDGFPEIIKGSVQGNIHIVEFDENEGYRNTWNGSVDTYNAYLHFSTKDIDGNGKPEFWVGGDAFQNGIGITRLTCFEADGDNQYSAVHQIDLVGIFSFFAGNVMAIDIDKDGREEIFICLDQHVIILKFTGTPYNHSYEVFFFKRNNFIDENSVIYSAAMYDLFNDGNYELLISKDLIEEGLGRRDFTRIYKKNEPNIVENDTRSIIEDYYLFQNYPNPFNPNTVIEYSVPEPASVTLQIYSIVGELVSTYTYENVNAGYHKIEFDASNLSSGTYVYQIIANGTTKNFSAVKKMMLVK